MLRGETIIAFIVSWLRARSTTMASNNDRDNRSGSNQYTWQPFPRAHTAPRHFGPSRARGSPTRSGAGCETLGGNRPAHPCSSSKSLPELPCRVRVSQAKKPEGKTVSQPDTRDYSAPELDLGKTTTVRACVKLPTSKIAPNVASVQHPSRE